MNNEISIQNKNFTELNPLFCGSEKCESGHSFGPNVRNHYIIHYVISGCGTLENENGKHEINQGNIFIIRPGEVTTYYASQKNPWEYIWIGFDGKLAKKLDDFPDVFFLKNASVFFDMLKCDDMKSMREEFLAAQLFLLYRELFKTHDTDSKHTHRVANYIKCNYMQDLSVESIAESIHLDRRYLSRIFKQDYGMSIKEFIIEERMSHARELLENGYSVRQASLMVGYTDVFNFSKMFKKFYKIPPSKTKPNC